MPSPLKQYTKELYSKFKYMAMWLPGKPISLGDIVVFDEGYYKRIGNIKDKGISFNIRHDKTASHVNYTSKGEVSVFFKAKGEPPPPMSQLAIAEAGFSVEMQKANATLFEALDTLSPSIENQIELGENILELYKNGKWELSHYVVTEILEAKSATILISNGANARIELSAKSNISPGGISIADVQAGLSTGYFSNMHTRIIAEEGLTPLFKASNVKRRFGIGGPIFRSPEFEFSHLNPEEITYDG